MAGLLIFSPAFPLHSYNNLLITINIVSARRNQAAGADGQMASESRGVGPGVAAEPATTASGTVAEIAACWEEGATGAAAAAGSPRQAAQAVAAAPPCFRGHHYNVPEISRSARGKVQSKTNIFHGF